MTLDEAIAAFESRFDSVRIVEPSAYLIEGKIGDEEHVAHVYVTVCRGARTPSVVETYEFPPAQTPEEAVAQWFATACAYATRIGGKRLVWRVKPELNEERDMQRKVTVYQVYSRLVVF